MQWTEEPKGEVVSGQSGDCDGGMVTVSLVPMYGGALSGVFVDENRGCKGVEEWAELMGDKGMEERSAMHRCET